MTNMVSKNSLRLNILKSVKGRKIESRELKKPPTKKSAFVVVVFGGVQVLNRTRDQRGNAAISKAKAVRILYSLDTGPKSDE